MWYLDRIHLIYKIVTLTYPYMWETNSCYQRVEIRSKALLKRDKDKFKNGKWILTFCVSLFRDICIICLNVFSTEFCINTKVCIFEDYLLDQFKLNVVLKSSITIYLLFKQRCSMCPFLNNLEELGRLHASNCFLTLSSQQYYT